MKRERLLFLSQTLPHPPDSGVKIRTYHTLRILSRIFDINALCFYRRRQTAPDGVPAALSALAGYGDVEAFAIPQEWSWPRWVRDHGGSLLGGRPYTDWVFRSAAFRRRIVELAREHSFDVVHFESPALSDYADLVTQLPKVCVHHNVESLLLARRAGVVTNPIRAAYLKLQASRLRALEARFCPTMDVNITVSEEDAAVLESIAPDSRFATIPNGVDVDAFAPIDVTTRGVVLLGGTDWFPNLDGLEFFAEEVLPLVRQRRSDCHVVSVGRASPEEIRRFEQTYGIRLTGYVDDIRPYVHEARCVVVPLRVGGGSRLKILDSWALGKAVISTSIGCEGLNARDGENLLIRDDAQTLADAVVLLLENADMAKRLGQAARREAVRRYSWEAIAPQILDTYRTCSRKTQPVSGE